MARIDLKAELERVVGQYVKTLCERFDWDSDYGYWVADDVTGIFAYGDEYFIGFGDIVYIVDNNVSPHDFEEWYSYRLWAAEFGQTIPNLQSWVKGCPRLSKREMRLLEQMKSDFIAACERAKERVKENVESKAKETQGQS